MLLVCIDAYRPPQSPFYQLPPKVQHYPSSQLLLSPTPPGLQQLLGEQMKTQINLSVMFNVVKSYILYHVYLVQICIQNTVYFPLIENCDFSVKVLLQL